MKIKRTFNLSGDTVVKMKTMKKMTRMKSNLWAILLLFACCTEVLAEGQSLSLKEAYERAIVFNQSEEINNARIESAEAGYSKIRGNYLPKIAFKGTYTFLDQVSDQKTMALNLSQNLFKGGKDSLTLDSEKLKIEGQKLTKDVEQQALFKDVAEAYYSHWQNEQDVKNLFLLKDQSEKRRNEIRERVRIGRSRKGELLQAESQLATVEANLLNATGLRNESAKKLSSLIGIEDQKLKMPDVIEDVKAIEPLASFLKKAESRSEIELKKTRLSIADLDVSSSKRNHLPTLDLSSNYYLNKRTGSLRNSDWDLSFNLTIPLFEGGSTSAQVKENVAKKMEAYFSVNDQQRKIESEVKTKYEATQKFVEQLKAGMRAFNLARENYDETLKDYRLGLVTNLDTLSALNTYLDAKRSYDRTKIQARATLEQLNASVGVRP